MCICVGRWNCQNKGVVCPQNIWISIWGGGGRENDNPELVQCEGFEKNIEMNKLKIWTQDILLKRVTFEFKKIEDLGEGNSTLSMQSRKRLRIKEVKIITLDMETEVNETLQGISDQVEAVEEMVSCTHPEFGVIYIKKIIY